VKEIFSDKKNNRVYVKFSGELSYADMKNASLKVMNEAQQMSDGFFVVADLTGFVPSSNGARIIIRSTINALKDCGMGQLIKVVPEGNAKIDVLWKSVFEFDDSITVHLPEDAEKVLEFISKQR